jgi:hypothetical protein
VIVGSMHQRRERAEHLGGVVMFAVDVDEDFVMTVGKRTRFEDRRDRLA